MGENLGASVAANQKLLVDFFLEQGVDINYTDSDQYNYGAVVKAVRNGNLEMAQYLVSRGAKLRNDSDSANPLWAAIHERHLHMVQWLVTTDMDIHAEYVVSGGGTRNAISVAGLWGKDDAIYQVLKTAGCEDKDSEPEPRKPLGPPPIQSSDSMEQLVSRIKNEVMPLLASEIREHVSHLNAQSIEFYGYAIQTPGFYEYAQPILVYNREQDLSDEQRNDTYHRFSVDEWQHYETDSLPQTCSAMTVVSDDYKRLNPQGEGESEFAEWIYRKFADVLQSLRDEGVFDAVPFLVVWVEDERLMNQIVKQLNPKPIADRFATEFRD